MSGSQPSTRKFPLFTILWAVVFVSCLALTFVGNFPAELGLYVIVYGLGVPLTLLMSMEWSTYLPDRRLTLFLVTASAAWWVASMLLVRAEFDWRIWHTLNTIVLLTGSYSIGYWLAREIEKIGHLIPVGILATLIDIWSVFRGPTKSVGEQVVEHTTRQIETGQWQPPPVVEFVILSWPQPGAPFMTPLFGFGDLVFLAFFFGISRRFGLSLLKTFILLLASLVAAFAVVHLTQSAIPALPFICGFFVLGYFRHFSLTKKEWQVTFMVTGAVLFFALMSWVSGLISGNSGN